MELSDAQIKIIDILDSIKHKDLVKMVQTNNYTRYALTGYEGAVKAYTDGLQGTYYPTCDGWMARMNRICTKELREQTRANARTRTIEYFQNQHAEVLRQAKAQNDQLIQDRANGITRLAPDSEGLQRSNDQIMDNYYRGRGAGSRRKKNTKRRKQKRSSASRKRRSSRRR